MYSREAWKSLTRNGGTDNGEENFVCVLSLQDFKSGKQFSFAIREMHGSCCRERWGQEWRNGEVMQVWFVFFACFCVFVCDVKISISLVIVAVVFMDVFLCF